MSIRADFRTTVEYLITLLESTSFSENTIDTAWLDKMIVDRVQAVGPNIFLSLCTAAIHIADKTITNSFKKFENAVTK